MTDTVPAAAVGLPSRRRALASIAGLTAALSLPKAASAIAAPGHPDADLIAKAAVALDLSRRSDDACCRVNDLDAELDRLSPKKPIPARIHDVAIEKLPDGVMIIRDVPLHSDPAAVEQRNAEAIQAWEAECEAIAGRIGLREAEDEHGTLDVALQAAVAALVPVKPTTAAGLAAKARVAWTISAGGFHYSDSWIEEFWRAVLRDTIAAGGDA